MDDLSSQQKHAYRHLLYCCLVELRCGWRKVQWWNPADWWYGFRRITPLQSLAYDFHNLAFFVREDFRGFSEDRFWNDLRRTSPAGHDRYRRIFESCLRGEYQLV